MKGFFFRMMFLLGVGLLLGACASGSDAFTDQPNSQAATPVPGEKSGEEGIAPTAGPGSAGAGVHW